MQAAKFQQTVSVLSTGGSQCPRTHNPVATLTIEVAWLRQAQPQRDLSLKNHERSALLTSVVVVFVLQAAVTVFMATNYVSGRLMQEMLRMRQDNQPRAQYSDVWKWQGHR